MKRVHYAWIILGLAFLALLSAQGVRLSFGAFIQPWENEYSTNRGIISLVAFISYAVFGFSQPIIGRLIDRYGVRTILSYSVLLIGVSTILTFFAKSPWQLMFIYGVIASIGFGGASNVAGSVAITNWFVEKRGFAVGLMSAGTAGGQLLLVPLSLFLINELGWKMTVIVLGLFLVIVVFPLLLLFLRTHPSEKKMTALGTKEVARQHTNQVNNPVQQTVSIFHLLKRKEFLFLLLPFFVCGVTTSGLIDTHLIPFAQYCGISPAITGTAVSLLAAFNIAGTVCSGFLADRYSCRMMLTFLYGSRALTIIFLLIIIGEPALLGLFLSDSSLLILFAISFGIVDFATVAPTVKLATQYFKGQSVGVILGWLFLSHQFGAALGAYLPGVVFDLTGNYTSSFIYSLILLVGASYLCFMLPKTSEVSSESTTLSQAT
jgi:MFS family permease